MGRSGIWVGDALPFVEQVCCMPNLKVEGIMTHFSSADDPAADDYTLGQIDRFRELIEGLQARGYEFKYIHAANTSAIVRLPQTHFNMVRPGLGFTACIRRRRSGMSSGSNKWLRSPQR